VLGRVLLGAWLLAVLGACGTGGGSSAGTTAVDTSAPPDSTPTTLSAVTLAPTSAPSPSAPSTSPAPTPPPTTLPVATTTFVGLVVGGSGGGVGQDQTDTLSEVVRDEDGSCAGWDGPGGGWTAGVRDGGEVVVFDVAEGGEPIATGHLGAGRAVDVDPPNEQWQCELGVTIDRVPKTDRYFVEVGGLPRVEARPGGPDRALVIPVNTQARADELSACVEEQLPETVGEWSSVGQYWSQGLPSICSAGLRITRVERVCRPPDIASDRVVAVVAANEGTVLENGDGLQVDVSTLEPGTLVIAQVSSAYPCG
jgi:hypothetical protein